MKLMVIYRKNSDHARVVYEFLTMLERRYPSITVEELDIDTKLGADTASLYGVVQYPALLALGTPGNILGMWEGLPIPLLDEVAGLLLESQGSSV